MITPEKLEVCADNLYVYDVLQDGWEQEHNGADANMQHVLTHLVKDLLTKDFTDAPTVRDAIAPDHLQYAVRFARWTSQPVTEFAHTDDIDNHLRGVPLLTHSMAIGQLRHLAAAGLIAQNIHDLDHAKENEKARAVQSSVALKAGRLLVRAAEVQASVFKFDLIEAFDDRLAALRERFHIPTPDVASSYLSPVILR